MVRWCWVNFQCQGVLLIWIRVGQGPAALAVGAGGGCLDIFTLVYHFYFLSPSPWETARYRLKYCLKGPLSPKQPTNQPTSNVRASYQFGLYKRQGPTALAEGAGGGCLDIFFSHLSFLSSFSLSLGDDPI